MWEKDGDTGIQLRRFTVRAGGHRFLWPWHRLFYLGRAGPLWFSQDKPGSKQNYGHVGILDAGLHAVHHRCLPADWTDLVRTSSEVLLLYIWRGSPSRLTASIGLPWLIAVTSRRAQGRMAGWRIAFLFLSILGVDVFRRAGDIPVMIIFVGLSLIYAVEIPTHRLMRGLQYRNFVSMAINGAVQTRTASRRLNRSPRSGEP